MPGHVKDIETYGSSNIGYRLLTFHESRKGRFEAVVSVYKDRIDDTCHDRRDNDTTCHQTTLLSYNEVMYTVSLGKGRVSQITNYW